MAKLLFFSTLTDIVGDSELEHSVGAEAITVETLLQTLYQKHPALAEWDKSLLVAVNCEYADRADLIQDGDEVAIMPPVQGG